MPKKGASKTKVVYRKAKRTYHRARGMLGGMGKVGNTIVGAGAGAARQVGAKFIGPWGAPLAEFGVGWFANNETALYMSGRDAGTMVSTGFVGMLPGAGTGGNVI